jgi:hypothetical protein
MSNNGFFHTLNEAYQEVLKDVLHFPEYTCSPRSLKIKEILGYKFTVQQPTDSPIITADAERNAVIADYTKAEFKLYDSLTRDAEEYGHASAFWKQIANPDGTINSAYGYLLWDRKCCGNPELEHARIQEKFLTPEHRQQDITAGFKAEAFAPGGIKNYRYTPWEWAIKTLRLDKDSRQAIMHFNTPDVLWWGNKDVTCTLIAQFMIRNDELHLFIDMRSNDVVRGLVYDCVWFASLMKKALAELQETYPNLKLGNYTHYAHSMHVYETQFEIAEKMIGQIS